MELVVSFMSANVAFACLKVHSSWNQMLYSQMRVIIKKLISDPAGTSNI